MLGRILFLRFVILPIMTSEEIIVIQVKLRTFTVLIELGITIATEFIRFAVVVMPSPKTGSVFMEPASTKDAAKLDILPEICSF